MIETLTNSRLTIGVWSRKKISPAPCAPRETTEIGGSRP